MFCPNPECPHRQETGHAAEFRDDVERCSDCGTPLVAADPAAVAEAEAESIEMAVLTTLTEPAEAAIVRALLDEAGIRYETEGEGVQDYFALGRFGTGFSPITGPPVLLVEAARLDEARELLASLESGDSSDAGPTDDAELVEMPGAADGTRGDSES